MPANDPSSFDANTDTVVLPLSWRTVSLWLENILKNNNDNGKHETHSKFNNQKSALLFMHSEQRVAMDPEVLEEFDRFLVGYKKLENKWRRDEILSPLAGKRPLPYAVYTKICEVAMRQYTSNNIDSYQLYCVLAWNLCTRSVTTGELKYGHLRWRDDCLVVCMSGDKVNQDGKNSFET